MNITECYDTYKQRGFTFFWGKNKEGGVEIFSQWHPSVIHYNGLEFPTAEHYMMYHKANLFQDYNSAEAIIKAASPKEAKVIGRNIQNFDQEIWDNNKYNIVKMGNLLKLTQHPDFLKTLLSTGTSILVEASPYDKIWGVGLPASDPRIVDPHQWLGENLLGFVLTDIKDSFFK
jgi:ribA/ribD-fused uncharacterized protein